MDLLTRRSIALAQDSLSAGVDAVVTIAARAPGLFHPSRENAKEAQRMVEEKISATYEGAFEAALAWNRIFVNAAFCGFATPQSVTSAFVEVADAAMAPARRTVRANAKRLTSRSRPR